MLIHFLQFYLGLLNYSLLSHLYRDELIALDDQYQSNQHYRRYQKRYQKKRSMVKSCWIVAGLFIIVFPILPFVIVLMMSTTFLSFSLLDETD